MSLTEAWMRGSTPGFHPVISHLAGRQLSGQQLAEIPLEGSGQESAAELMAIISSALDRYEEAVRNLSPDDFGAPREIGRRRHPATAISIAIHIVEHAQRHIGGLIAAAKLVRGAREA